MRTGSATEELERQLNRAKSRVRARVEHVFGVVKRLWGFDKCATVAWPRTRLVPSSPLAWPTSTLRTQHCMDKSARERRQAGELPAVRPETGPMAVKLALNSRCGLEMQLNSGAVHDMATGWPKARPCSA